MKYVGRYDAGTGYMEWAGSSVDSIPEAKDQLKDLNWANVDVVEVKTLPSEGEIVAQVEGEIVAQVEGEIVASAPLGRGWIEE